jgi:thiol-disulfide isomerase/thioredoxin
MSQTIQGAPELAVSQWFNTSTPLSLSGLRGRPIFLHSFQLLCPGCVSDAIPQVRRIEKLFGHTDLQIIGLHTVFEHHAAMSPVTLKAFISEYRLASPVGVDQSDDQSDIPVTMRRFGLRGTPSSVLIGRDGAIIQQSFGVEDDLVLGARLALALSAPFSATTRMEDEVTDNLCANGRCELPSPNVATASAT